MNKNPWMLDYIFDVSKRTKKRAVRVEIKLEPRLALALIEALVIQLKAEQSIVTFRLPGVLSKIEGHERSRMKRLMLGNSPCLGRWRGWSVTGATN